MVNKLNEGVLKTGDNQGTAHGKTISEEGGNTEVVGNEVDDKYKNMGNHEYLHQIYVQEIR